MIFFLIKNSSGSYTLELADGKTQTIYYISGVNGHRVSIDKPFTSEKADEKPASRKIDEPSEDEELKEIKLEEVINELSSEPKEEIKAVDLEEENHTEESYDDIENTSEDEQTEISNYEDVTDAV